MKYKGIAANILLLFSCSVSANTHQYGPEMGTSEWEVYGNRLYCQMKQTIPAFGEVIFRQRHAHKTHLIVKSWWPNQNAGQADVIATAPIWKRYKGKDVLGQTPLRTGHNVAILSAPLTEAVLSELQVGNLSRVQFDTKIGNQVKVDITPESFQGAYAEYAKCLGGLLPFPFRDVKISTVNFDVNGRHLSRKAMYQLNKVKEYVMANKNIKTVKIDGYTDGDGRGGHNLYISELRAKAVADYLIRNGVPEGKISVTWHGSKNPVADNDTHMGRALNRRVSIKLLQ